MSEWGGDTSNLIGIAMKKMQTTSKSDSFWHLKETVAHHPVMETNAENRVNNSASQSTMSSSRSQTFRESSTWFLKIMTPSQFDKCCMVLAEILGTATLMFLGCAGTIHWDGTPNPLIPPFNFGLTVMLIVQVFGHISLALLNPAVAICAVVNKLISIKVT